MGKHLPTIKQHIPNFVSGIDPVTWNFENRNELLSIDFVKRWIDEDFHQFSVSEYYDCILLMAELEDGNKWYVIGYITGISEDDLGLPKFKAKRKNCNEQ